ncbi:MAG: hypothetical protein AMXMBFR84_29420 [Candidatus Hydrogenedentota bacterium]
MEDNVAVVGMIFLVAAAIAGWRLLLGVIDRDSIRRNVERRGDTLISMHWTPFGRGWFSENKERHYRVVFTRDGTTVETTCKTSIFTGVYWSGDELIIDPEKGIRSPSPKADHRCPCEYPLQTSWRYCPNCGRKCSDREE